MLPITTASKDARKHFMMGRDAAHHYQFAEAREQLDAAIAADPSFVLALLHRGGSAERLPELQEYLTRAAANRNQVSEGEQQMIDAFHAFLLEEEYDRAIAIFTKLSEEYPDDPYILSYLGLRYYRNQRRYEEAAVQFRHALERDSGFVQAYNWLGYIAMDQGDNATAEEMFRQYIHLAPDQPRPYNSLGMFYFRQGRYDEAARYFEQAFTQDPRFTESRDNFVRASIEQVIERFEEAVGQQDADAIAALYTEDGQLLPPGSGEVEGADAIRHYWQDALEAGITGVDFETLEVYTGAESETATELGRYRYAAGIQQVEAGNYIVVWQRNPDGWHIHRQIRRTDRALGSRPIGHPLD
jgi:uncharacterized protein (TIGR02246 family)